MRNLSLAFCFLLAACANKAVRQVSPIDAASVITGGKGVVGLTFDNNKAPVYYAAADVEGRISIFNLVESALVAVVEPEGDGLISLRFSNTNDAVIAAFRKGGISSCQIYTKRCAQLYSGTEPGIFSAFLPVADEYVYQTEGNRLDFIGGPSMRVLRSAPLAGAITAFSLDGEKKNFIVGLETGDVLVWSVMGRGALAQAGVSPRSPVILVKQFSYSELPSGGLDAVKDPRRVPRKTGVLALDSEGAFHLFAVAKAGGRQVLRLINTVKSGLNASFRPVIGGGAADYMPFSNPSGELRFFAFETAVLEYEDKEFAEMTSGMPVSGDSAVIKVRLTLPNLEEKSGESLGLSGNSVLALAPDGKYFAAGSDTGETQLIKNPVVEKRYKKLADNADAALKAKKYDLAITMYSQALGIYVDKDLEAKRDQAWDGKRAAQEERMTKTRNLQKGR